ncbi:MAG: CPBP family intramembrane metalloprotease [Sphingomonadales bacterium]|nr:CPBP family intramembrane metalloprotease [Sphingomonadales bacterium]
MTEEAAPPETAKPGLARRIVMFPVVIVIIEFAAVLALAMLVSLASGAVRHALHSGFNEALFGLLVGIAALAAYHACQRWVERRPDAELALPGAVREWGAGLLTGFVLFSAITGIVAVMGGIEFLGVRGWGQIGPMLGMALYSGPFEEVLFRGVLFRHIESWGGTWIALALTSAFFGFGHLANPNATVFAGFAIAMEAGILLGAAYLLTRRLWLAIGIHSAWNFTQGWVYSIPVSGSKPPIGLLNTRVTGPEWMTGGPFGLEASVVALVMATLTGVLLLVVAVKRGQIVRPRWAKR